MPRASRKKKQSRLQIIASLFVIFAIPAVVLGIMDIQTYDTRSQAGVTGSSSLLKCKIKFLYVDPNTIEKDKTVTLDVSASLPNEQITNVSIVSSIADGTETEIFSKDFTSTTTSEILEIFTYKPEELGKYSLSGYLSAIDSSGSSKLYPCLLEGGATYGAEIVQLNNPPEFITAIPPKESNILKVGDSYNYTIEAQDIDSYSSFDYAYSFSPNTDWLQADIEKTQDGSGGKLTVQLDGIADYPASYLVNLLVWDGYNGHTRAQAWVINVDPAENDYPDVDVTKPIQGTKIKQGQDVEIAWTVTDQNHIVGYKLYISANPTNQNSWIPIDENIGYDYGAYILNTANFAPGDYVAIVQATDNQEPPLTGTGISTYFNIGAVTVLPSDGSSTSTDDGSQIREAEVTNISPDDGSTIKNVRPIIKATVVAAKDATVAKDSINFKLEDKDLTDKLKMSDISNAEISLIYTPSKDLEIGSHKATVEFEDTKGNKVTKNWSFTIEEEEKGETYVSIFGYKILFRTAIIGGIVAFGLILLAIIVPWLLYGLFKKPDEDYQYDVYPTYNKKTTTTSETISQKPASADFAVGTSPYYTKSHQTYESFKEEEVPVSEVTTTKEETVVSLPTVKTAEKVEDIATTPEKLEELADKDYYEEFKDKIEPATPISSSTPVKAEVPTYEVNTAQIDNTTQVSDNNTVDPATEEVIRLSEELQKEFGSTSNNQDNQQIDPQQISQSLDDGNTAPPPTIERA